MKADKKVVASAGVAGTIYLESSLPWLLDKTMDLVLAYKDIIPLLLSSL